MIFHEPYTTMNKTCLTFLLSLSVLIAHAQSEELVYWNSQSTYNYSYPQYGDSLATVVSSAIQTPSGLTPYQFVDSRNIWYNPNLNLVVNPSTYPYLEFALNLNSSVDFDRFVIHGLAPASGDVGIELRWDVDNYASALGNFTPDWTHYRLTSVDIGGQPNVPGGLVKFRLYYYKVAGDVYHSDTGPFNSVDGTPSSYSSYWRCFSVWGEPVCTISGTDTQSACGSFTWIDGNTYTSSTNSPTHTLSGAGMNGCDSLVTLDLTIATPTTSLTANASACGAYIWNGTTYTNSGTYTWTGQNNSGCDSVATLNLMINTPTTSTSSATACGSYTWNGTTYTTSGSYTWTGQNSVGCDSTATLNLTINTPVSSTDTQVACNSFTWIDGNTYTSSVDTVVHTYVGGAANNCDSLVTLDLTINSVSDVTTTVDATGVTLTANNTNATYQWIDCDSNNVLISNETNQSYTATENGNYAVQLTENGCVDTTECVAITSVGLLENDFGTGLVVYPNPTDGKLSIDLGSDYPMIHTILTDITGKVVQSNTFEGGQLLDLTLEAPIGVYLLNIETNEKKVTIRLIKE